MKNKKLFIQNILYINIVLLFYIQCINKISFSNELTKDMSPLVEEVSNIIKEKYIIEGVKNNYLKNSAVDGMLRGLDPFSGYYDEEELQNFKNNTDGVFYGIGIEFIIDINLDCPVITNVFPQSPAKKSGLIQGDVITHINDKQTHGKKQNIIKNLIKGEKNTPIKLTIYRSSTNETFSKIIRRDEVKIPNVVSKIYKNRIAIMEIKLFNQTTYNDFVNQLNEIMQHYDIKGLILDLRNNPGGLLDSAVDIANLFLKDGQLITSVKGRNDVKMFDYVARNKSNVIDGVKIAILINKGSASASEILASCLQDYNIATLIGEQTFGKALVQEIFELKNSKGAVKITTGQYHTPKDKQINGVGIKPDIQVQEKRTNKYDAILQAGINFVSK